MQRPWGERKQPDVATERWPVQLEIEDKTETSQGPVVGVSQALEGLLGDFKVYLQCKGRHRGI